MVVILHSIASAQTIQRKVIGSAGKTQTAGNIILRSTTGEAFTKNLTQSGITLQQGFQHGTLILSRIENNEVPATSSENDLPAIALSIYPNPTTDFVHIKSENENVVLEYILVDASGKTITSMTGSGNDDRIEFTAFSPGTYFLIALDKENQRKSSFKIVKTN